MDHGTPGSPPRRLIASPPPRPPPPGRTAGRTSRRPTLPLDGAVEAELAEGYSHEAPRFERSHTDPNLNKAGIPKAILSAIQSQPHVRDEYRRLVSIEVCRVQTPPQLGVNDDYTFTLTLTDRINYVRNQA